MTSPYLLLPLRSLDQVTGRNVLRPAAWNEGDKPPRVLIRAPMIETDFDMDNVVRMQRSAP